MNICNGCVNTEACIFIDKCIGDVIATNKMHNTFKTLRDEFAMAALSGLGIYLTTTANCRTGILEDGIAAQSYRIADAMLAAREEK